MASYTVYNTHTVINDSYTLRIIFQYQNPVDNQLRPTEVLVNNGDELQVVYDAIATEVNTRNNELALEQRNIIQDIFGTVENPKDAVAFTSDVT